MAVFMETAHDKCPKIANILEEGGEGIRDKVKINLLLRPLLVVF